MRCKSQKGAGLLLFEQEIYNEFIYVADKPFFHSFLADVRY